MKRRHRLLSVGLLAALLFALLPALSISTAQAAVRSLTFPTAPGAVYARYQASDYNATSKVWVDSSGNNYNTNAYRGAPILTTSTSGTGSLLTFPVVQGGTADGLQFPSQVLPATYTFFSVARFNGTKNRIFDGVTSNWLSGFYAGGAGAPVFHGIWMNPGQNTENPLDTNWVVGTDQANLYRSNGVQRSNSNGSTSTNQLSINDGWAVSTETSQWQVAEIIVYNSALSLSNIQLVENYLMQKYGVSQYSDSSPVYSDFTSEYSPIVGDLQGGGSGTYLCPAGKIAIGFAANAGAGGGIGNVELNCKSVTSAGVTSGADSWTSSGFGTGAGGTFVTQNCAANSAIVGLNLYQGNPYGSSPLGASYAYYVGGATPICATLPAATSTTLLTQVGGASNAFGTAAQCASGGVVVGFTGKYGSVANSIGVICSYVLGASGTAINGIAEVGQIVSDTNTYSPRIPTINSRWETSTVQASGYFAINGEVTTAHTVTNNDKNNYIRFSRDLVNFAETATLSSSGVYVYGALTSTGSDISIPYGQKTTANFSGVSGSGGYTYALSSTPTGISINSSTGVLTVDSNTARTSYNLTVTVTDSYGATSTKSTAISVTGGVVTGGLSLSGGATTATYRTLTTITASVSPAGKITFYQNGKAIPGCKNKLFSATATCAWKPSIHGGVTLYARVTPTDSTNYSAGNTPTLSVGVATRSGQR